MKKQIFIFIFFFSFVLSAQKPSFVFFEIKNEIKTKSGKTKSAFFKVKANIAKNKNLSDAKYSDTLFLQWKNKKEKTVNATLELRQNYILESKVVDNQLDVRFLFDNIGLFYKPKMKVKDIKVLPQSNFKERFEMPFLNNSQKEMLFQTDSLSFKMKVTLRFPKACLDEKADGMVTIYYRSAREHLNPNAPQPSSGGKALDWGHAFIGVKDLKSGKTYFLDGWPDEKLEEGSQHFAFNKNVDSTRTADHHTITFTTDKKRLNTAIQLIKNYQTACIDYEVLDYNCTDMTTKILEKMDYYTQNDKKGKVLPKSFANDLMEKLDKIGVCYEFDGRKIK